MSNTKRSLDQADEVDNTDPKCPKSFVFKYGKVSKSLNRLTRELRRVMEPNTASKLREKTFNKIKDYMAVAGPLGVTHFIYLSQNSHCISHVKFFRFPHGPSLTFRLKSYSLMEDIQKINGTTRAPTIELAFSPFVAFSNFDDSFGKHISLTKTFLQNLFPSLDAESTHSNSVKRVVLFHYDNENDLVILRHYVVSVKMVGVTKNLEELLSKGKLPDLHNLADISEYLIANGVNCDESGFTASAANVDSAEMDQSSESLDIVMNQNSSKNLQKRVQLIEIGPRLSLELIRVQQESEKPEKGTVLYDKVNKVDKIIED